MLSVTNVLYYGSLLITATDSMTLNIL